jgi:hypothetical protein
LLLLFVDRLTVLLFVFLTANLLNGLSNGRRVVLGFVALTVGEKIKSILLSIVLETGLFVEVVVVRLRRGFVVVLGIAVGDEKSTLLLIVVLIVFRVVMGLAVIITTSLPKSRLFEIVVGDADEIGRDVLEKDCALIKSLNVRICECNCFFGGDAGIGRRFVSLLSIGIAKMSNWGSTKLDVSKSPSLLKGSRSSHGCKLIGANIPDPHRMRSLPANSDGKNTCGCKKFELPMLRHKICCLKFTLINFLFIFSLIYFLNKPAITRLAVSNEVAQV